MEVLYFIFIKQEAEIITFILCLYEGRGSQGPGGLSDMILLDVLLVRVCLVLAGFLSLSAKATTTLQKYWG